MDASGYRVLALLIRATITSIAVMICGSKAAKVEVGLIIPSLSDSESKMRQLVARCLTKPDPPLCPTPTRRRLHMFSKTSLCVLDAKASRQLFRFFRRFPGRVRMG